jgi:hypothetical protein
MQVHPVFTALFLQADLDLISRATARPATAVITRPRGVFTLWRWYTTLWLWPSQQLSCWTWIYEINDFRDCPKCEWFLVSTSYPYPRHQSMFYDGLGYFAVLTGKEHRQKSRSPLTCASQLRILSTWYFIYGVVLLSRFVILYIYLRMLILIH